MRLINRFFLPVLFLLLLPLSELRPQATDFSGYRIFINPGHGGNDSNDRHMLSTGFWESEGNLEKGLYLRDLLENMNATVYMSRTTNTTADDLPLSVIDEMANAAEVDFFLAIHSNGSNGTVNRPLMLFRGYDDQPVFPDAKVMADILWRKIFEKGNCWTHSGRYVKGDWTFYPEWGDQTGLGVLRTLTMPGVLSEGSFHDYVPESWRLRNADFLHHESWAFLRSMMEFYSITPVSLGVITGTVRDTLKSPSWYFKPGTRDEKLPVNRVRVSLMPGNKVCTTDSLNNGFFFFDSLPPGAYKLHFTGLADYRNDSLQVTVTENQSTLVDFYLQTDTIGIPDTTSQNPDFVVTLYPNPVQNKGTVRFKLPEISRVSASIYDSRGRMTEDLYDANLNAGDHEIHWNPSPALSAGTYHIQVNFKSFTDGSTRSAHAPWVLIK